MVKHTCESCEFWVRDDYSGGHVCCNSASDSVAEYTDAADCCFEYEAKEKLTKDEIVRMMKDCTIEMNRLIDKLKECDAMNV